jgi:hypothetical protein
MNAAANAKPSFDRHQAEKNYQFWRRIFAFGVALNIVFALSMHQVVKAAFAIFKNKNDVLLFGFSYIVIAGTIAILGQRKSCSIRARLNAQAGHGPRAS